ncbi:NUDIX domain-containing protein [uncultured Paracoccus sp.]|uniref:NUDIX domain-containing protein n=1 Tax=uncultured Paracoccus sp. TaxID=189685 RepID=UPI00262F9C5A|nr:NUDIX domain-containing protein [uncultured Paracoccus sp.]
MSEVVLFGPLAHPSLREALGLAGREMTLEGRLVGGQRAGIDRHGWPVWQQGPGQVAALAVTMTPRLARYAAVMGLTPVPHQGMRMMGAMAQGPGGVAWSADRWPADLVAGIARAVLAAPEDRSPAEIARRLPMIGTWIDSTLRAAADPLTGGDLAGFDPDEPGPLWRAENRAEPYADFFAVEEMHLSHRLHGGGWSPVVKRAGFVMGDAVVVLPWDAKRDRVLLIDQFRVGPAMRGDRQPWMLEAIAGRIDVGETPEIAARREALEEAQLPLGRMFPALHHYPSPGAIGEYLYCYVAKADLPDDAGGIHGLDSEAEDIRSHLVSTGELARLVMEGQISNGPLALLALWFQARLPDLKRAIAEA